MEISNKLIFAYLKVEGASNAGIATPETLAGGPPSTREFQNPLLRSTP
jgi:hypothetical protein